MVFEVFEERQRGLQSSWNRTVSGQLRTSASPLSPPASPHGPCSENGRLGAVRGVAAAPPASRANRVPKPVPKIPFQNAPHAGPSLTCNMRINHRGELHGVRRRAAQERPDTGVSGIQRLGGCPVCSQGQFSVGPEHVLIPTPGPDAEEDAPVEGSAVVPVMCGNCGYTMLFSPRAILNQGE